MKPVVTWIVLANAREARVVAHHGPGKGLVELPEQRWRAEKAPQPRDRAGVGHSIAGPGIAAVEQSDAQLHIDTRFAQDIVRRLGRSLDAKHFERLVLVAGPHMLGLLRAHLTDRLRDVITGEIVKDLSTQPMDVLEARLGDVIAV
ncbi:host attachment protein [Roseobacter sp. YSTF-M11]|uniref:Host attachment protein n=1 Tax=Roseobacter insulae TaxID=2859783 RepID=A0A9X1JWU9_9RHOB|nr:host attachment protein [Roseobacter insulae]MBW4706291.1 host attachment protein [Roseobacter insulae]